MSTTHRFDDEYRNERESDDLDAEITALMERLHKLMLRNLYEKRGLSATLLVHSFDPLTGFTLSNWRTVGDCFGTATVARRYVKSIEE